MPSLSGTQGRAMRSTKALIAAREAALAGPVQSWLNRLARVYVREAVQQLPDMRMHMSKAYGPTDEHGNLYSDLEALLTRYGIRTAADAANGSAGVVVVTPGMVRDAMAGKDVRIKYFQTMRDGVEQRVRRIAEETKNEVRGYVQSLVAESFNEFPRPSVGEIARRIRNTLYSGKNGGVYTFSSERAAVIARTEVGQAQAQGEAEGYIATSNDNDAVEWLGHNGGGRSHGTMTGKRITIADMKSDDESRWFQIPDTVTDTGRVIPGCSIRFPRDPEAPIGHTVNCECAKRKISAKTL